MLFEIFNFSGIVNFMLDQAKPAAKLLKTANDKFMNPSDISIVGFFESESGPLYEAFVDAAERTRGDFSCHYVTDRELMGQFNAKPGQITIYYPTVSFTKLRIKFAIKILNIDL